MTIDERRRLIVAAALSWQGTPFRLASAAKGPGGGVDCAGLVMAVFAEVGMVMQERLPHVDPHHASHNKRSFIIDWLERHPEIVCNISSDVTFDECHGQRGILAGDVVCYRYGQCVHHCGIALDECWTIQSVYPYGVTTFDMTGPYFWRQYHATFRPILLCQ
jgi:cell wall-associated NlpC family hydrolase